MAEEVKQDEKAKITIEFSGPKTRQEVKKLLDALENAAGAAGFSIVRSGVYKTRKNP